MPGRGPGGHRPAIGRGKGGLCHRGAQRTLSPQSAPDSESNHRVKSPTRNWARQGKTLSPQCAADSVPPMRTGLRVKSPSQITLLCPRSAHRTPSRMKSTVCRRPGVARSQVDSVPALRIGLRVNRGGLNRGMPCRGKAQRTLSPQSAPDSEANPSQYRTPSQIKADSSKFTCEPELTSHRPHHHRNSHRYCCARRHSSCCSAPTRHSPSRRPPTRTPPSRPRR